MPIDSFGCVNNTIRLRSGKYFDLANPRPEDFTFGDIAGALAKICRFGAQCQYFYSVAEHCWHCCQQAQKDGLPLDTQQAILLHDAAEAFVGDVVKPLKIMLPTYSDIEKRVEAAIAEKFLIDFEREKHSVQKIDHELLIAERRYLFSPDKVTWSGENDVRTIYPDFKRWTWALAEVNFLQLAQMIGLEIVERAMP